MYLSKKLGMSVVKLFNGERKGIVVQSKRGMKIKTLRSGGEGSSLFFFVVDCKGTIAVLYVTKRNFFYPFHEESKGAEGIVKGLKV